MRVLAVVLFVACGNPDEAPVDAADPVIACNGTSRTTTLVENVVVGPVTTTSVTVPISAAVGGELLVVTVASTTGNLGYVRMSRATPALQVRAGDVCDKALVIWTVKDLPAGVSSFEVTHNSLTQPTSFVVFASIFTGGPWSSSLRYGHGAHPALACPGDVVVSSAAHCDTPTLATDSAFTQLDAVSGFSSAYLIAPAPAYYSPGWTTAQLASTWIQF